LIFDRFSSSTHVARTCSFPSSATSPKRTGQILHIK
jgi:hypothetical protein